MRKKQLGHAKSRFAGLEHARKQAELYIGELHGTGGSLSKRRRKQLNALYNSGGEMPPRKRRKK